MTHLVQRHDGRMCNNVRPLFLQYDIFGYADASVFLEQGNTKVLVSVKLQPNVPPFLKGQKTGWLTAEYAMLPNATQQRTQRESSQSQRNPRSVEISRFIGRCLRPTIDLAALGERSIMVDCDVLQADGSTRVACITAASIALKIAVERWLASNIIEKDIYLEHIAALSVGIINGIPYTDLSYIEDSHADADFNFVITRSGKLVEIQGTCEKIAIPFDLFEELKQQAITGINEIFVQSDTFKIPNLFPQPYSSQQTPPAHSQTVEKAAFFSLKNRLNKDI